MDKKLVIVESPSKTKAIEKYLGSGYRVVSSKGHIRDLSKTGKYGFGVDLEDNFKPKYEIIKNKKQVVTALKKDVKSSDFIYLATDPDREGEAISWHLKDALDLKEGKYKRVVFNEITKDVVVNAFKKPRDIDDNLVKSQETRRILDRIIGFRLSKLMQSKTEGKSAGRVQSVALRLVVEKEEEINSFIPKEYWQIKAIFDEFDAQLDKYKSKKIEINNESEAQNIIDKLDSEFIVTNIEEKIKNKKAKIPFITSTLQQEASTKLNFSPKKTMSVAQKLYEGIDIKNDTIGLITYMRTDSIRLSDDFVKSSNEYIINNYAREYLGSVKVTKSKNNIQDAHEAIRPTSILKTPENIKEYLTSDEYKLYSIIYYRTLASLMKDSKIKQTSVTLLNNGYEFKVSGQILIFDGYLKVYSAYESSNDIILPIINENTIYNSNNIEKSQHFTEAPSRYTEAKLIKEMEELGIGRPSTYAKTIETLTSRAYVNIIEKKLHPTKIGIDITNRLKEYFENLINVKYTAIMEEDLDKIADGKGVWYKVLEDFYKDFEPSVDNAFSNMQKKEPEQTGELCEKCGKPLIIKTGKYGKFTACSGYPECKYIKQEKKEVIEICNCIKCEGKIIEKKTKKGKIFYGCNNYPKCKEAFWDKPSAEVCPVCNEMLIIKNEKIKCNACNYEK